ncbi:MAG: indolepyruvate ferredoxin oxidoreductase family protein [Betaproteobacteria bacterium]|nr:indolepyruvate ferredoxin oxidoreductase family protein [Betaproteobacteria bacterium]
MNAPLNPTALARASLEDRYTLERGRAFLTGSQALVRLLLLQRERDLRAGLHTGGYVSGYRGSPLGVLDQTLVRAKRHLDSHHIVFQPGVNEDLAATAIWGTQQVGMFPGAKYDGVFGMWYGKGPGVDRCGDVFKHANSAGTSKNGGVLVLAGDDHAAKSSTLAHQSEHILKACCIPVLSPASVQDYLDLGVHGYAMSRYAGLWIGFKCVTDVVESGASVEIDPERVNVVLPADFALPPGGLNIRWPDGILEQEARLLDWKVYAALAYARANRIDRIVWNSDRARLGIATTGKSYGDTMQALADLGIDEPVARDIGLRVYKVAMSWPLEPDGARRFAEGLEEVLVIEEKRQLIEYQLKEELYSWEAGLRAPRIVGKFDDNGEWSHANGQPAGKWLLPAHYEHSPAIVARAIAARLAKLGMDKQLGEGYRARLAFLEAKAKALAQPAVTAIRQPYFCSGCPHNTSTRVPEGSRATAGIGCHFMAVWMDRRTATFTHMGGEGASWLGQAPFTAEKHIFANLGDGTYFHSGLMAIRAAVASRATMTYKILYNDAVAMTGGQRHDGPLDPAMISRQIAAEGVKPIVIVTDEPHKYPSGTAWAAGVTVRHRDELDTVQRELREIAGVSAIIYDQTCASEKRRRRKRHEFPDPPIRALINERVCEGCGDCSTQSNCLSVEPLETEFGRKRRINQSTCNKDYSCVKGFCPSFVTVEGGRLRRGLPAAGASPRGDSPPLPEPRLPDLDRPYPVLVTGIGGTGVITIGQILAMAAHLEGKAASVLDMSGLAQKGGPVMSHVKIAAQPGALHTARLGTGDARLVIGCDLVVAASGEAIEKMGEPRTCAVVNSTTAPTAEFVRNPQWRLPGAALEGAIAAACGASNAAFIPAAELATRLMGDSIATNMFMLGYAWQKGWVPLSSAAIERAIELNDVAVDFNRQSFVWGRRYAHDAARVQRIASPPEVVSLAQQPARTLDEVVERRVKLLTDYQNARYAEGYRELVGRVRELEAARVGSTQLAEAVARGYAKLLAYKDEYEVARLYADGEFARQVADLFEGDYRLVYHLAPPLLARVNPATGEPRKMRFGGWTLALFRLLARLKGLRGGAFDPFGRTAERRSERELIREYEETVETLLAGLTRDNHALALELAMLPEEIRGYGHIKLKAIAAARAKRDELLRKFETATTRQRAAA